MEHKELRKQSVCPNNQEDYLDFSVRRIGVKGKKYELINQIFDEEIAINLTDNQTKIEINNCEFKKGLFIRWEGDAIPKSYSIFIYKSEVNGNLSLVSVDIKKDVIIDLSEINKLYLSGISEEINFYGNIIEKLYLEDEKCESLRIEKTTIKQYALYKVDIKEIEIDRKDLVITDYKRFISQNGLTILDVSYIYHKLVLPLSKSISETRKINYEIAKATSSKYLILFGYFFNPIYVFYWMIVIIALFSVLYFLLLGETLEKSIYFSIYTFLTIGFGDIAENNHVLLKAILVFIEGFLGITYCAVFLTSIINSSKK